MGLIGIGIDLVDILPFKSMYDADDTDLTRVFSEDELLYAGKSEARFIHLAARFAAKEAALKALGCGLQDGISLTDVVVIKLPSGAPQLQLTGGALREAERLGVVGWMLSLTHSETTVGAVAIALSADGPR
ncbi:holo-ACP synthase [Bradyrhizobium sp. 35]|uniref:holo-ACP synthase n=1 Tax=unclassified Bradyrhizobium TaxID=2631580 RepID=UPI000A02A2B7|nr:MULTISPECIES: holo-ACP synthase [unclassified Bradyrhizobium]MCK1333437.1 holo-ACP synthase [Bradyrhizobium sp. CW9]MCK1451943.1 holo-ACP synthase [Bradyrhizobium sp. 35]UPK20363.1 holo-ACP synthase [Bradyrhizobium sp. 131]